MVTDTALIEVVRTRRSKAVPRHFVLAVNAERVVAFGAVDGGEEDGPYEGWVRPGERGTWPFRPGSDTDPSTNELIELLAG